MLVVVWFALILLLLFVILLVQKLRSNPFVSVLDGKPLQGTLNPFLFRQCKSSVEVVQLLQKQSDKYGPMFSFPFFHKRVLVINDVKLAHHLFSNEHVDDYSRIKCAPGSNLVVRQTAYHSIFVVYGEKWRWMRKYFTPAFRHKKLKYLTPLFVECTSKLLSNWHRDQPTKLDIHNEFIKLTMDIIGRSAFGVDFHALDGHRSQEVDDMNFLIEQASSIFRFIIPYLDYLPLPNNFRILRSAGRLRHMLDTVIADKHQRMIKSEDAFDLIDLLLDLRNTDMALSDYQMTDQILRDNLFLFFIAGHETASTSLSLLLYELARTPGAQERLVEEVDRVLCGREPEFEDLDKLEYVGNAIKESMRLHPVGPTVGRDTLNEIEIEGYRVPAGTQVMLNCWAIHHDEKIWKDPFRFDPDRFLPENCEGRPMYAWMGFGAGPHMCLGYKFAMMELRVCVAMIYQKYTFSVVPGFVARTGKGSILHPIGGVHLLVHPRRTK